MPKTLQRLDLGNQLLNRFQDQLISWGIQFTLPLLWTNIGASGTPPFQDNWVNFDGGTTTDANHRCAAYSKDASGIIRLRGLITGGTSGTTVFTLPAGYRPIFNMRFSVDANGAFGVVRVTSTGNVDHLVGSTTLVQLGAVEFLAEN